jgi:hypothetical protein
LYESKQIHTFAKVIKITDITSGNNEKDIDLFAGCTTFYMRSGTEFREDAMVQ